MSKYGIKRLPLSSSPQSPALVTDEFHMQCPLCEGHQEKHFLKEYTRDRIKRFTSDFRFVTRKDRYGVCVFVRATITFSPHRLYIVAETQLNAHEQSAIYIYRYRHHKNHRIIRITLRNRIQFTLQQSCKPSLANFLKRNNQAYAITLPCLSVCVSTPNAARQRLYKYVPAERIHRQEQKQFSAMLCYTSSSNSFLFYSLFLFPSLLFLLSVFFLFLFLPFFPSLFTFPCKYIREGIMAMENSITRF